MNNIRIVEFDYGFRIQEIVTNDGHYIEWPGLFSTYNSALDYISKLLK